MGNCRPKILECLNDVNDFLERRCEEENLFTPCRPIRRPRSNRHCDCDCNCDCNCDRNCDRNCDCDCDCNCNRCRCLGCNDCCHDCENVFSPCPDKRNHRPGNCCKPVCEPIRRPCPPPCCCGNDFAQMLCCLIGKKVRIAIGPKCGTVCILDVQGNCVRAMVVGSGKIVIINADQITQIREIC